MAEITVAVAGQPNSGKSTMFNLLTGARQYIANYPGVTVEKKTGYLKIGDDKGKLVDLPGTYSLSSYSIEETVARDYLLSGQADLVLNIIDASNLERSLNLTLQLLEIGLPVIVVLNMMDVVDKRKIKIDLKKLSQKLNTPVVKAVAKQAKGKTEIKAMIKEVYYNIKKYSRPEAEIIQYSPELEADLEELTAYFKADKRFTNYSARWLAVRIMAGDKHAEKLIREVS
ncbi:FeoB small GTPase domain-containing protein [Halanaerobium salsuginis]|uniref:Fe(2+) transporter FeoB n=1 Tax=Halanaerobium salsuginis TaxID=29563 RepID=A0A1I4L9K8_9FIRM|nr:FeoB small GTPase domain-containing protein [Halanaerobium salsuginis]SFL87483.1 ferrous iron transport protein B [Halanaerobium salsuginis]